MGGDFYLLNLSFTLKFQTKIIKKKHFRNNVFERNMHNYRQPELSTLNVELNKFKKIKMESSYL